MTYVAEYTEYFPVFNCPMFTAPAHLVCDNCKATAYPVAAINKWHVGTQENVNVHGKTVYSAVHLCPGCIDVDGTNKKFQVYRWQKVTAL